MRYFWLVLVLFMSDFAIGQNIYSPEGCEFEVEFPVPYSSKTSVAEGGVTTHSATAKPSNAISLAAECWSFSKKHNLTEYAKYLREYVSSQGISVGGVLTEEGEEFSSIILTGTTSVESKTVYIHMLRYLGTASELDLVIVEEERGSAAGLNFRNSVRFKNGAKQKDQKNANTSENTSSSSGSDSSSTHDDGFGPSPWDRDDHGIIRPWAKEEPEPTRRTPENQAAYDECLWEAAQMPTEVGVRVAASTCQGRYPLTEFE